MTFVSGFKQSFPPFDFGAPPPTLPVASRYSLADKPVSTEVPAIVDYLVVFAGILVGINTDFIGEANI